MGFWFGCTGLESDHLATETRLKNSEWQYWKGNDSKVPSWETSNTSLYQSMIQDITQQVATDTSYHLNTKHIPVSASEMRSLHFLFNIVNMTCFPFWTDVRTPFPSRDDRTGILCKLWERAKAPSKKKSTFLKCAFLFRKMEQRISAVAIAGK